ncbi:ornithine cyclodeaminase family protein [Sphaerisporangium perillae]|uniref:ornithine cyclodeaminase family protein n=1 Tax=Sphaerisporangium perillae TaxID=2935860 RepID=UPI002010A780|nr:ornithine cyclodeaminase family protein [Sphaerisporangium perillae]
MLFLDSEAVRKALPMEQAIGLMAGVMRAYSGGEVTQPLRTILRPPAGDGVFAAMPCHVAGDLPGYGLKAIMLKPGNREKGLPVHVGVVLVFDPGTGYPLAMLDGAELTAIRTSAVSAVATDALAVPGAGDLAIIGSGVQARGHLEALALVRSLRRVRVYSPTAAHAEDFRRWAASWLDVPVEVMPSAGAALAGADLVCTTTSAKDPVVAGTDLAPGAHVNAVGASVADARELSSDAVARCAVFVDSKESAASESGDLRVPLAEGLTGPDHVLAELGEVLLGRHEGRRDPGQITLYKSLGMAAQDIVSGFAAARSARELGLGIDVPYPAR